VPVSRKNLKSFAEKDLVLPDVFGKCAILAKWQMQPAKLAENQIIANCT
jgi:hypothetical protein